MGWEVEDLNESEALNVLNEIEETHAESVRQEQEVEESLFEAVRKIEEAMLWKTLLTTDIFGPGSARPEIIRAVNEKIKKFALDNLNISVGLSSPEPAKKKEEIKLPFDNEEMQALKILAAKVLKRDVTKVIMGDYNPQVTQVAATVQKPTVTTPASVAPKINTTPHKPAPAQPKPQPVNNKRKNAKPKPGPGYIPPTNLSSYIPGAQAPTVQTEGVAAPTNIGALISNLVQQATGGQVMSQSGGPETDLYDPNERF